jgi:solute carrier family 15 oligopeptide transporter 1
VVLSLYLVNSLSFDESMATVIFHVFVSLCYFLSLPGAMLADSLLGKFKTIFYLSVVYALGNIILSLGAVEELQLPSR